MRAPLLLVAVIVLLGTLACADAVPAPPNSTTVVSTTFNDTCTGDEAARFMQTAVHWNSTATGSIFTFDACGTNVQPFSFVRLIINARWTNQMVVNFAIPVADPVPSLQPGCLTYTAPTDLLVIQGMQFVSELRAVSDPGDAVNFLARRCVN